MLYRFSSLVLAALLTGSLLWGQCASCPLILRAPAHHDCCGGHCNMPHPKQQGEKRCPSQVLSPELYHKAPDSPVLSIAILPAPEAAPPAAPVAIVAEIAQDGSVPAYSPPDIYLLNSAILA